MNKIIILAFVIIIALGGAGFYFLKTSDKPEKMTSPAVSQPSAATTQKQGDTTKTGVISQASGRYFLTEVGASPMEIDSYAVELADFVGQTITVTGQYSGDTLFVGSISR